MYKNICNQKSDKISKVWSLISILYETYMLINLSINIEYLSHAAYTLFKNKQIMSEISF